ncbi:uncharacterized protein LOC125195109 [Salvia hispanica]|uniref:uncharacterized protein LOC125195109 n=1 Tax=Salvia hispanica TaxID=49212 RepID=UPI0020099EEC|nr:uncharacterized protein LOC125195109 [Salvia hispanica]
MRLVFCSPVLCELKTLCYLVKTDACRTVLTRVSGDFVRRHTTKLLRLEDNYLVPHFQPLSPIKKEETVSGSSSIQHTQQGPAQEIHLDRLVGKTDTDCLVNLRMDRNTFGKLCRMFRELGLLRDKRFVCIEEQVAIFLGVLAHHKKNRIVRFNFMRSGHTISGYVHKVLKAVIQMQSRFIAKPDPIKEDCVDYRWKWFKGCLGALDGTYINVLVPTANKPRYRTRKGQISTNTLAACDRYMCFTYVLPGWEGSAGDARILRDVVTWPHGLKVPIGKNVLI